FDLLLAAFDRGKHVVTANKEVVAKEWDPLREGARLAHRELRFEAAVGAAVPVVRGMMDLGAIRPRVLRGLLNGTTTYICSRLESGIAFAEALAEAQAKGYAEADPTDDVDGFDAAYKLSILASIAFQSRVDIGSVFFEGIRKIGHQDIAYAKELGYVIKLVGIAKETDGQMELRVHPVMLPSRHPLAAVNDVFNAIYVRGNAVGEVMFYGRGAGMMPTGSAVMADIMETARNIRFGATGRVACTCFETKPTQDINAVRSNY